MTIPDHVGKLLAEWYVDTVRTVAFMQAHRAYPMLCDTLKYRQGENHRRCANCGWKVEFHENSTRVKRQDRP